jgi:hypothetical protein
MCEPFEMFLTNAVRISERVLFSLPVKGENVLKNKKML